MALSTVTITFDVHQILGDDFDARRTKCRVYTNVENQTLMDTSTGEIRMGDQTVTVESDGTGTFDTWAPGADGNPISWQTYVVFDYPRTGRRDRVTRTFGPYTITASGTLADLEEEQAVPAEYVTSVTEALNLIAADAASSAADAESSADDAAASAASAAAIALGDEDAALAGVQADIASDFSEAQGEAFLDDTHPLGIAARTFAAPRSASRLATLKAAVYPVKTSTTTATITVGSGIVHTTTGTTSSTLTNPINYAYNTSGKWRFLGGVPGTSGNYYENGMLRGAALAGSRLKAPWKVEFMHSGQAFEFAVRQSSTGGRYRIMVDGEWACAEQSIASFDGQRYLHKVDFGSRGRRRVTIHLYLTPFGGLNIAGTDSVWLAPAPDTKVLVLSDSYGEGAGGTGIMAGWPVTMAEVCGFLELWNGSESSTGYVAVGAVAGAQTFQARFESLLPQMGGVPDVVVILGGYNDNVSNGVTGAAAQAAATACYNKIRELAPNVDLFVVGVQNVNNTESAQTQYIRNAVTAAGDAVTAFFDTRPTGDAWITGTGKVGSTAGNGNADVNIASDGVHPHQEGHDYYGNRVGKAIRDYYFEAIRSLA